MFYHIFLHLSSYTTCLSLSLCGARYTAIDGPHLFPPGADRAGPLCAAEEPAGPSGLPGLPGLGSGQRQPAASAEQTLSRG